MEPCPSLTKLGLAAFIVPFDPACQDPSSVVLHPTDRHIYPTAPLLSPPVVRAWPGLRALCIRACSASPANRDPGTSASPCGGSFVSSLVPSTRNCPSCVSFCAARCVIAAPNHDDASSSASHHHCANNLCGYCPLPYRAARASVRLRSSGTSGKDAMPNNLRLN